MIRYFLVALLFAGPAFGQSVTQPQIPPITPGNIVSGGPGGVVKDSLTALTSLAPLASPTFTGTIGGAAMSLTGTLGVTGAATLGSSAGAVNLAGITTVYTAGSGGLGSLTVGSGGANHIVMSATAAGTPPGITGTGSNGLTVSAASGTLALGGTAGQAISLNGAVTMPSPLDTLFINFGGGGQVISGSTYLQPLSASGNISGTYTGTSPIDPFYFSVNESVNATAGGAGNNFLTAFAINSTLSGTTGTGNRQALSTTLWINGTVTDATSAQQYVSAAFTAHASVNVGGTSSVPRGYLYGANPVCELNSGATFWTLCNGWGEGDIWVQGMQQSLTVSGTPSAGQTVAITFTPTGFSGWTAPETVTATVASGNTVDNIADQIEGLILQDAVLSANGVGATTNFGSSAQPIALVWQTSSTTSVAVSVATTGGIVAALGSVTNGASARQKYGMSIVRLTGDGQHGHGGSLFPDIGIKFGTAAAPQTGAWDEFIGIDGDTVGPKSAIVKVDFITGLAARGKAGVLPSPRGLWGIHLANVDYADQSGYPLFMPGFSVNGYGTIAVGSGAIGYSTSGMSINSTGYVASAVAISSGGGGGSGSLVNNYFAGDIVVDVCTAGVNGCPPSGTYGGQYKITSVNNSTGAGTGISILVPPASSAAYAGAIATAGGSGSGLTITLTWSAAGALNLQSGGGAIVMAALPTSCAGKATGTIWNNANVLNICP